MSRPVQGTVPVARDVEGKSLPRAYIARRRSSPRGVPAIAAPEDALVRRPTKSLEETTVLAASVVDAQPTVEAVVTTPSPSSVVWPMPSRQLMYAAIGAIALIVAVSATVAVVVERSMTKPAAASPTRP
jgi:hypothetical protein